MQESLEEISSSESDATTAKELDDAQIKKESVYIFRHGVLPPYRQMFYQLCDIYDDEVQALVVANDGEEAERGCTWMDGWCVERMQDKARDIISKRLKETLMAINGEEGTSSKESSAELRPRKKRTSGGETKEEGAGAGEEEEEGGEEEEEEEDDGDDFDFVSGENPAMEDDDDDEWDSSEAN